MEYTIISENVNYSADAYHSGARYGGRCKYCGAELDQPLNSSCGSAIAANEHGAGYIRTGDAKYADEETARNSRAYGEMLRERGCSGICIQYDSGSCRGSQCKTCEVYIAGLCCKRYLVGKAYSNFLEKDGGDYRNLMGDFARRLISEGWFDADIRRKLTAEAVKADSYKDNLRRQVAGAADGSLIYEWQEFTLGDILTMLPNADNRPVRIEIQLLIYMFYNFRYPIDLEHAESRFMIPRFVINRYLRSYFGYSYTSLLAKIRNEYSKTLLGIPLLRIGEIGAIVGYKSHYHYSLNFKRYEGISPKEYRESLLEHAPMV